MKLSFQHTVWACNFGFISQAVVNNLAPLLFVVFKERFGLTDEQLGWLILMNFGTQIVADILATRYVDRLGQRICAVIAHLFCACGLILMGVLPFVLPNPYAGLCVAAVLYAMGGGIIEVMISPIVEALPGEHKEKAMSMVHSFYCWGQAAVVLISTLLLWRFSQDMWRLLPIGWALIPLANAMAFTRVPLMPATSPAAHTPGMLVLPQASVRIAPRSVARPTVAPFTPLRSTLFLSTRIPPTDIVLSEMTGWIRMCVPSLRESHRPTSRFGSRSKEMRWPGTPPLSLKGIWNAAARALSFSTISSSVVE